MRERALKGAIALTIQSGTSPDGKCAACAGNDFASTAANSLNQKNRPPTMKRWPDASGWVIARTWALAASRTSTTGRRGVVQLGRHLSSPRPAKCCTGPQLDTYTIIV